MHIWIVLWKQRNTYFHLDKGQCTTWPFIFYSRMVASKFLLSEKAVDQLKNIISCYIQILSLEQKQNSPVLKIGTLSLSFTLPIQLRKYGDF